MTYGIREAGARDGWVHHLYPTIGQAVRSARQRASRMPVGSVIEVGRCEKLGPGEGFSFQAFRRFPGLVPVRSETLRLAEDKAANAFRRLDVRTPS